MSVAKRSGKSRTRKSKRHPPRHCLKCGFHGVTKNGLVGGEQRWKCKKCAYQFTRTEPRGRPLWQKSLVVFLYSQGVSMHAIAKIFQVQPSTVFKWIRAYGNNKNHKTAGDVSLMELTDMRSHLNQKGKRAPTLCIAIHDKTFKESIGIAIQ